MDRKEQLIASLEKTFGKRNPVTSRFGSTSLGEIADNLCLSNSLLTKLISGTATEGMYERCTANLERINSFNKLQSDHDQLQKQLADRSGAISYKYLFLFLPMLAIIAWLSYDKFIEDEPEVLETSFLSKFFNPEFDVPNFPPYVPINKIQDYCPCGAFEGDWALNQPYTIPIPFNKPGLYYVASDSDVKLKCVSSADGEDKGKLMHGFEIMKHVLWMDSKHESLAPRFFNESKKQFTKDFYQLDFEGNERFEKLAEITSFFYNKISIDGELIRREGEPAGRFASFVDNDALTKYKIDVSEILNHVVGDMIKTDCSDIPNPYCNPNTLVEGQSLLEFSCNFSISLENLGFGGTYPYTKGFKLLKQHYSHNLLCNCMEDSQI